MKGKKLLALLCVLIIGSIVMTAFDRLLGVSCKDLGVGVVIAHRVGYMLFGVAIFKVSRLTRTPEVNKGGTDPHQQE